MTTHRNGKEDGRDGAEEGTEAAEDRDTNGGYDGQGHAAIPGAIVLTMVGHHSGLRLRLCHHHHIG